LVEDSKLLNIKLIDFDTAESNNEEKQDHRILTPYYAAPEIIKKEPYNEKVDIWSTGCLMYVLLSGRTPFNGLTNDEIERKVKAGEFEMYYHPWGQISDDAKTLIDSMLKLDPKERISAADALQHKWF